MSFKHSPGCNCCGSTQECENCDGNTASEQLLVAVSGVANHYGGCMSTECTALWNKTHTLTNATTTCGFSSGGCSAMWHVQYGTVSNHPQNLGFGFSCVTFTDYWNCTGVSGYMYVSGSDYLLDVVCVMCDNASVPCNAGHYVRFRKNFGTSKPTCTDWSSLSVPYESDTGQKGTVYSCNWASATCSVTSN